MFSFTAKGRIGRIDQVKTGIIRISIAAERIVQGQHDTFTKTEWISAVCFDPKLSSELQDTLEVGATAELSGHIEPRKREVDGRKVYDLSLVIERFNLVSKPKAKKPNAKGDQSSTEEAVA